MSKANQSPPILSLNSLAWRLGVVLSELRSIASNIEAHYHVYGQASKSRPDITKTMRVPKDRLKWIQRRIVSRVLAGVPMHGAAQGGVTGCSPSTNARAHAGQRCVLSLDVPQFYESVRHETVYRMFRHELGFGRDVASLLTKLTTLDSLLPRGAPTSPVIGNLILSHAVDGEASLLAEKQGLQYTRYIDDLTFSGDNPRPVISAVAKLLSARRLRIHRAKREASKLKIMDRRSRQEVTGLVVNGAHRLSLGRDRRDAVRAAVHRLEIDQTGDFEVAVRSVQGRIGHVQRHNNGSAKRLKRQLEVATRTRGTRR